MHPEAHVSRRCSSSRFSSPTRTPFSSRSAAYSPSSLLQPYVAGLVSWSAVGAEEEPTLTLQFTTWHDTLPQLRTQRSPNRPATAPATAPAIEKTPTAITSGL